LDVINPATNAVIARVANGTAAEVDAAVSAARGAFAGWKALSGHARARHLYALARGVQKHARLLAVLESMDNGKSIRETRDIDVPLVARHFYHHAGWAQLLDSEFAGYEAIGVVGQIIPWNFPLLMLAWKIAPALAAGNTIVLKPAEFTPLTALCFAEIAGSGFRHAVNIVNGHVRPSGDRQSSGIDRSRSSSTEVGRIIAATAGSGRSEPRAGRKESVHLHDADRQLVECVFNGTDVVRYLLVQEGVAERLVVKLRARMEKLRLGSPLDKAVDMGTTVALVSSSASGLVQQGGR
jgi:aldehyde dehydrogenase (NAD+)